MEQLDLFSGKRSSSPTQVAPLAERMRPRSVAEFVGQGHLLGAGKILDRLFTSRQFHSLILWGPPGCGKTTLARLIAENTDAHLIYLSAVMAGTREIRAAVLEAGKVWTTEKRRTWLFMDEIHRLNKAQQDTLLPHVENGTVLLLGATTENPSFEVIRPLLSRSRVLVLEPLGVGELKSIISRALADSERGLGRYPASLTEDAEEFLVASTGGDARVLLNALEMAVLTTPPASEGEDRTVTLDVVKEALQRKAVHYDKGGEEHYNLISALHKSVRGSDPDAALYWFSRMMEGGEDPLYLGRRLVRMAVEDIGLADPQALVQAMSAVQAYQLLGSPEGDLCLAQVTVYLALAPKSNSTYTAFGKAREMARNTGSKPVPLHIRNAPTELLKELGYGRKYRYPHDAPEGWIPEDYFPEGMEGTLFFDPTPRGWEGQWKRQLERRRKMTRPEPNNTRS